MFDKCYLKPLHEQEEECVKILIQAGADLARKDSGGHTPLQRAMNCAPHLVKVFLDNMSADQQRRLFGVVNSLYKEEQIEPFS
jgi:ankyrin repeat protein